MKGPRNCRSLGFGMTKERVIIKERAVAKGKGVPRLNSKLNPGN